MVLDMPLVKPLERFAANSGKILVDLCHRIPADVLIVDVAGCRHVDKRNGVGTPNGDRVALSHNHPAIGHDFDPSRESEPILFPRPDQSDLFARLNMTCH